MNMYYVALAMKCSNGEEFRHDTHVYAKDKDDAVNQAAKEVSNCKVKKVIIVEQR
jgi:hypothetical protein